MYLHRALLLLCETFYILVCLKNFHIFKNPEVQTRVMYQSISKPPNPPPSPPPPPGAFDFFEKFWSNSPLCWQFRRSNAPPVRALKRVKSPPSRENRIKSLTFGNKQNCLHLETSSAKFSATTNFLFSLSSLHALN